VVGQQFRETPPVFLDIKREFDHRLVHFGFLESRAEYLRLLAGADVVLSTAMHEFQGVAVMEAVQCGCVPLLPARLAYLENYPGQYLYHSSPDDPAAEASAALARLREYLSPLASGALQAPNIDAFSPRRLRPRYAALFDGVITAPG
jgi:glycosyltransferase involved in cell wall biosynthesis